MSIGLRQRFGKSSSIVDIENRRGHDGEIVFGFFCIDIEGSRFLRLKHSVTTATPRRRLKAEQAQQKQGSILLHGNRRTTLWRR